MSKKNEQTKVEKTTNEVNEVVNLMELPLHEVDENGKLERISTGSDGLLAKGVNPQINLAGVCRILGDVVSKKEDVKKQTIHNKVSKIVAKLRTVKQPTIVIEKAMELTNKSWSNIKDCGVNEDIEMSEETKELWELLSSIGKKGGGVIIPENCPF